MGWGEDLWNAPGQLWNSLTGNTPGEVQGREQANRLANFGEGQATKYGGMFNDSFGANAGDFMRKSRDASSQLAQEQAQYSSMEQAKNALKAARGMGLNRGQAALQAGQATGSAYGNTYNNALNSGMDRYTNATNMLGNQAQGYYGSAMGANQNAYANATQQSDKTTGAVGGLAGGLAQMLTGGGQGASQALMMASDEDVKTDVKSSFGSVDEALKHLKAVRYKYKDDAPTQNAGKEEIGIMAQDLEKVPGMAGAVVEQNGVKKIDGPQLEGANTALIIELASRIKDLEKQLGGK